MKNLIIAFKLCFCCFMAIAQHPHKAHKVKLSCEAKTAVRSWHETNVYPVKKAAHDQFMASLSQDDFNFIEQKRAEMKVLEDEKRAIHQQLRTLKKSGLTKEEMQIKAKEAYAPLKEKHKALMQSLKPFVEQHKESLRATLAPLKEQKATWDAEKRAILEPYLSEEDKLKMEARKKKLDAKMMENPSKATKHKHRKKRMGTVKFIMWDGTMKASKPCKKENSKQKRSGDAAIFNETLDGTVQNISNYPNPAINQTTILFDLTKDAKKVKLKITDMSGKLVWKKNFGKMAAGEQKIDIDLRRFVDGTYLYSIQIEDEVITKQMLIQK